MEQFVSCYLLISDRIFPSLDIFRASLFRMSELAAATADEAEPSAAPMAEEAPADNDDDDEVVDDSDDDTSDLSLSERFARAAKHKEQGNARFKSGDPAAAAAEYRSGLGLVDELAKQEADRKASLTPGEAAERDELSLSLQVRYASRFRFEVEHGQGFDIVLSGCGTYEEHVVLAKPARI